MYFFEFLVLAINGKDNITIKVFYAWITNKTPYCNENFHSLLIFFLIALCSPTDLKNLLSLVIFDLDKLMKPICDTEAIQSHFIKLLSHIVFKLNV